MIGPAIQANCAGCRVYVTDAELRTNGTEGIRVSGGARVYVDHARMEENQASGASVLNDGELYVRTSVVHRNKTGFQAITFPAPPGPSAWWSSGR